MNKRTLAHILLSLGVLSASCVSHAAEPENAPKASRNIRGDEARNNNPEGEGLAKSAPARLGRADRAFITKAAEGRLFEIAAAELAAKRSTDARIKEFSESSIRESKQALQALKQVGVSHNYPLPEELTDASRKVMARLEKLSGRNFDRSFRQEVGIKANEQDIDLLKRSKRATRNEDLTAWIDHTLPSLKRQKDRAAALKI